MYPPSVKPVNIRTLLCLALAMGLSGCATTRDCDPRVDPGFFGAINCHASDAYRGRIAESNQILENERALKAQLSNEVAETERKKQETEAALRQAQADLATMDRQLGEMDAAIKRSGKTNKNLQAKLKNYRAKISQLKKAANKGNVEATERDRLRRELEETREQMRALSG